MLSAAVATRVSLGRLYTQLTGEAAPKPGVTSVSGGWRHAYGLDTEPNNQWHLFPEGERMVFGRLSNPRGVTGTFCGVVQNDPNQIHAIGLIDGRLERFDISKREGGRIAEFKVSNANDGYFTNTRFRRDENQPKGSGSCRTVLDNMKRMEGDFLRKSYLDEVRNAYGTEAASGPRRVYRVRLHRLRSGAPLHRQLATGGSIRFVLGHGESGQNTVSRDGCAIVIREPKDRFVPICTNGGRPMTCTNGAMLGNKKIVYDNSVPEDWDRLRSVMTYTIPERELTDAASKSLRLSVAGFKTFDKSLAFDVPVGMSKVVPLANLNAGQTVEASVLSCRNDGHQLGLYFDVTRVK